MLLIVHMFDAEGKRYMLKTCKNYSVITIKLTLVFSPATSLSRTRTSRFTGRTYVPRFRSGEDRCRPPGRPDGHLHALRAEAPRPMAERLVDLVGHVLGQADEVPRRRPLVLPQLGG